MAVRALTAAVLVLALGAMPAGAKAHHALRAFHSCAQLVGYARAHGTSAVKTGWTPTPFTEGVAPSGRVPTGSANGGPAAPQASGAQDSAGAGAGETFSTTNVQEQG